MGEYLLKKYKTLLFDLDDTLLDFGATEDAALRQLFDDQKMTLTLEIKAHYKKINEGLWKSFERGEIDREELLNTRFSNFFKEYGIDVDGALLEAKYRTFLKEGHHLMEGAMELISTLHKNFELYIVTNGDSTTQFQRLKDSGLAPFFKDVFVSEDAGFQKPTKEFFDFAFKQIENFEKEKSIIIGDSLTADITGGYNVGMDTCWINVSEKTNDTNIIPTYEIKHLNELYQILDVEL